MKMISIFSKIFALAALLGMPLCATAQAVQLAYGQSLLDTLETASSIATFKTPEAQPGDLLFIRASMHGPNIKFDLYDPGGNFLKTYTQIGFNNHAEAIFLIPASGQSGKYVVVVSATNLSSNGEFCISIDRMNESPAALSLGCGSSLNGSIPCGPGEAGGIKSFRFSVQQNARSRITVAPTGLGPEVWLCDKFGNILFHQANSLSDVVTLNTDPAAYTGCFYVFVGDSKGFFDGDFSISHALIFGECASGALASSTATGNVCVGNSFTLTASSPLINSTYSWTGPNNFTSTQAQISFNNATPSMAGTYTVTISTPGVCSGVFSKTIVVNQPPTVAASITNDTGHICIGDFFRLNAIAMPSNGSYSYLWTGPGGFSAGFNQPGISVSQPKDTSKTGIYTVVVTDNKGCTASTQLDVVVNPLPKATISQPTSGVGCIGQSLQLFAESDIQNSMFLWSGPGGFASNLQNPFIQSATNNNEGSYKVTVTSAATGCSSTVAKTIYINDPPNIVLSGFNPVCLGDSTLLTAFSSGNIFQWSTGSTKQSVWVKPAVDSIFSVTVTDGYGCRGSKSDTVHVKPLPIIGIETLPGTGEICVGSGSILLCALTDDVQAPTVKWSGPLGFSSTLPCNSFAQPNQSGIYSLTVKDGNTLCSNTISRPIAIRSLPSGSILQDPAGPSAFCEGLGFNLIANYTGTGLTYQWTRPNGTIEKIKILQTPHSQTSDAGNYNLLVTDVYGCSTSTNKAVDIFPKPIASISGNLNICEGSGTLLTASGGGSYLWSTGQTTVTIQPSPAASTTYFLIVTSPDGCEDTTFSTVEVMPNNLSLTVNTNSNNIQASALGGALPYTYSITPAVRPPNETGIFSSLPDGTYTVSVYDANGCRLLQPVTVTVILTIEPGEGFGLSIFPNPGAGEFVIRADTDAGAVFPLHLGLFDASGHRLKSFEMLTSTQVLDLTELSEGLYLLRVSDGQRASFVRIIIMR